MKLFKKLTVVTLLFTALLAPNLNAGSGATAGVLGGIGGFALGTALANRPRREYREVEYVQTQPQVQYVTQPVYQDTNDMRRLKKKLMEKDREVNELKDDLYDLQKEVRELRRNLTSKQEEVNSIAAESRKIKRDIVESVTQ